ncbi:Protein PLANT CADMIUM RESISTANCE 3 [Thelohanellus kitauei]|uniref:Protein PLANT CADMIUM RESISTANCE 3 n=1 Tax=Thelohanellus kitauei TaxID=669202 RepID=A0A0C2IYF6_THEKT|nr:Protein PLANT CADMIUM RESISTANCE 3 [Thelohanellus kitauei]
MSEFKEGLFKCFWNFEGCCLSWYCPCLVSGFIAREVGENFFLFCLFDILFPPGPIIYLRHKVREQHNIEGSIAEDVLVGCCCICCSQVQSYTELGIHMMR